MKTPSTSNRLLDEFITHEYSVNSFKCIINSVRIRKGRLAVVHLAIITIIGISGIHAQDFSHSNTEYHIKQYQVADGAQFSSTDPTINLTMECLAANGYGQWTVTSNAGSLGTITSHPWVINPDINFDHAAGWYLIGNLLSKASEKLDNTNSTTLASHPGCQPPGVIAGGHFSGGFPSTNPKATANLYGQVRYIWVEPTNRVSFIIQGLNDAFGGSGAKNQINIGMNGIPNPMITTQVIKSNIFQYTSGSTNDGNGNHAVTNNGDWRDQFDIACDKSFIYIVWCYHNPGSLKNEVWATVLNISDGSVANANFPLKVAGDATNDYNNPTVACDVRYDNSGGNGAQFDVGLIARTTTGNGTVIVKKFVGNVAVASETMAGASKKFHDPFNAAIADHAYFNATHARVLVSSISGSSTLTHCIYVREGDDLILYKPLTFAGDVANYVDGVFASNPTPKLFPSPIPQTTGGNPNNVVGIADDPIIAFANPYDNQSGTYNQFHCMYRLNVSNFNKNPLVIVRGNDNGFGNPVTTDTRLLLNQDIGGVQADPTSYIGAINQMGAHLHWRSGTTHFYSRDTRFFDEPIEENTLISNDCYLADGTGHGGTVGAALVNSKTLTLWSDPNYGAVTSSTTSGMYLTFPHDNSVSDPKWNGAKNIGSLNFGFDHINSSTMTLTIGEDPPVESATLVTMPVCLFGSYGLGSFPMIQVDPTSTWESYQVVPDATGLGLGSFAFPTLGLSTSGTAGNLNIHGGATFGAGGITGNKGNVDILFEPNLAPQNLSTTLNSNTSGLLILGENNNAFTNSTITSHIPSGAATVVVQISGTVGAVTDSRTTLSCTTTNFTNSGSGVGIIQYNKTGYGCKSPDKVIFNGGTITRMRFHAIDPIANLTLENLTLDQISEKEIFIERVNCSDASNDTYGNITVNSNTFAASAGLGSVADQFGIYLKAFSLATDYGHLNVNSNIFTNTTNASGNMQAAIAFENSTGNVETNTITDDGYIIGINLFGSGSGTIPTTKSYLCSNTISGLAGGGSTLAEGIGLKTDNYNGYVKLCTISSCTLGLVSGSNDNPFLAFTNIQDCSNEGIRTISSTADVDLSGVHGTSSSGDDYSAPNTIKHNGGSYSIPVQVVLTSGSKIEYGNVNGVTWWTDFGNNNTEGATGNPLLIRCVTSPVTAWNIGDLSNNFWEVGTNTLKPSIGSNSPGHWHLGVGTEVNCTDINYSSTSDLTAEKTFSGVTCSGSLRPHGNNPQPLAILVDTMDECARLRQYQSGQPQTAEQYKFRYDSLRHYIELCANQDGAWHAFPKISGAAYYYDPSDSLRFNRYRDWLITVLYLNTNDPFYFCADMEAIMGTYGIGSGRIANAGLAIMKYLLSNPYCNDQGLQDEYNNTLRSRHDTWQTKHDDGDTTAEDTVLPSLDKLGLGFLLKNGVHSIPVSPLSSQYISSYSVSENPFIAETKLRFTLSRMAYVTIEICDELGRPVYGNGTGRTFEAGSNEIVVDGKTIPSGTLYVRIANGFGEVKTVKLIHKK